MPSRPASSKPVARSREGGSASPKPLELKPGETGLAHRSLGEREPVAPEPSERERGETGLVRRSLGEGGHSADSHDLIRVQGARVNNLKDVSVEIPKRRLT